MKRKTINITLHTCMKQRVCVSLLLLLGILCRPADLPAAEILSSPLPLASISSQSTKSAKEIEYEVKAAFIYNFMKFIEWPPDSGDKQNTQQAMVIGILGDNPFGNAFVPILDKEVHGRKIKLVEIPSFQAFYDRRSDKASAAAAYRAEYQSLIDTCDILFLCFSEKNHIRELTEMTPGRGILTISDISDFARHLGIIGFVKDSNKIRFEINLKTAQRENFKIRSQLLALAKAVHEK